jgi:hypothetical protein
MRKPSARRDTEFYRRVRILEGSSSGDERAKDGDVTHPNTSDLARDGDQAHPLPDWTGPLSRLFRPQHIITIDPRSNRRKGHFQRG